MNTHRHHCPLRALLALALMASFAAPSLADEATAPDPAGMLGFASGAQIYAQVCQGCHMPGGTGANGAGQYPAFAGNPNLASAPSAPRKETEHAQVRTPAAVGPGIRLGTRNSAA